MTLESIHPRVLRLVREKLGQYRVVRRASWEVGTFVHHTLPRIAPHGHVDSRSIALAGVSAANGSPDPSNAPNTRDPLHLRPARGVTNPVLTGSNVTDFGPADGVADPFTFLDDDGTWHMFMEVYNRERDPRAAIGHATSRDGGKTWEYDAIVLRGDYHLSYPYVFEWDGTRYMVPDRWNRHTASDSVTLFEARRFPDDWTEVATIRETDHALHDVVVFRWQGTWWAIGGDEQRLYAYYSPTLRTDQWEPHAENPVVRDRPRAARPGGRPLVRDEYVLYFLQDCARTYGEQLRAYRITDLTPERYEDVEVSSSPIVGKSGSPIGWNSGRMHHVDARYVDGSWLCAVDGNIDLGESIFGTNWAIGIYESRG